MKSQIKEIYITKNKNEYSDPFSIWFQYREFIDLYLSKDVTFRAYINHAVVDAIKEMVPNCEIIFIEHSDDYIINKFNEYLIDRLKDTDIKYEYIEDDGVDYIPIGNGKFIIVRDDGADAK